MTHFPTFPTRVPLLPRYPEGEPTRELISELVRQLELRDREVNNYIPIIELSKTFAIDSIALIEVSIDNEFGFVPAIERCMVSIVQVTDVDDWKYDLLKIDSISTTNVKIHINVSDDSATGSSTAKVVVWIRP